MENIKIFFRNYFFHLIAIGLITIVAFKNYNQRKKSSINKSVYDSKLKEKENKIKRLKSNLMYNYYLSSLGGKNFPFADKLRKKISDRDSGEKILMMIINFRLCKRCLKQELNTVEANKKNLNDKGITPIIIFGLKNNNGKNVMLKYKKHGLINIPYFTVKYSKLNNFISLLYKDNIRFVENPQYLLLNNKYQVVGSFKAPRYQSEYLKKWIKEIINN